MSADAAQRPSVPQWISGPMPVQPQGSRLARGLLALAGWKLDFPGLPGQQGVILVYPHTSNWDFILGLLGKAALGVRLRFWAKDSLFKVPLFGPWVRSLGGVAVDRNNRHGLVGDTAAQMQAAAHAGQMFWLAAAPEGTRSLAQGWRSGAYQVALQAGAPVGLATFDFATRTIALNRFVRLSGDVEADLALMAEHFAPYRGKRHHLASPIRMNSKT